MSDNRIPIQDAIDQAAAVLNMPREQVEEYARQLKARRTPRPSNHDPAYDWRRDGFANFPKPELPAHVHAVLPAAAKAAMDAELAQRKAAVMATFKGIDVGEMLGGVRLAAERLSKLNTRGVDLLKLPPGSIRRPQHPNDRRTIRLAGRPKHFFEIKGRLTLVDGESPWT